jgi:serine/threonine protein kinase
MALAAAAPDIPGFHALSQLGAGPSSSIFSAQSEGLGRWVALTIYQSPDRTNRTGPDADRFRRGFELTRRLGVHPHAITLLDWGLAPDGSPYIVTEFYEHGTFDTRVSGNQPLPVDKTLRIGIQVAGALETAHRAGVVHGGVHPARVLADSDDEPSLADIGLVPLVDPSGPDALLGPTNHHAPPEVLEGNEMSPATDVYSLASTLHTLLTAHPPYRTEAEDTAAALLLRVLRHEHSPLNRPDAPATLVNALRSALHPDPRQRPASVLAFAQTLQGVQREIGAPQTDPVLLDVAPGLRGNGEPAPRPPATAPAPSPATQSAAPPQAAAPVPSSELPAAWPEPSAHQAQTSPAEQPPMPSARQHQVPSAPADQVRSPSVPTSWRPETSPAPQREMPSALPPVDPIDKAFVPYPAPEAEGEGEPHEAGSGENPAGPPPSSAPGTVQPPALAKRVEPHEMHAPATALHDEAPPTGSHPRLIARGPKALPVIVLGAIVAVLVAGATWMVVSGSDPSDASSDTDPPTEQPAD